MQYPRVLTIAGSDSGGGAGIQADIKAISATGSYAASAVTAVTVQNTLGVEAVHPVPPEVIAAQIRCVLSDIGADAVKIGMLHSADVIRAVAAALKESFAGLHSAPPCLPGTPGSVPFGQPDGVPSQQPAPACLPGAPIGQGDGETGPSRANIVLDPVMVSTSGHRLIEDGAIKVLKEVLIPMARIITPNLPEAVVLAECRISSAEEFPEVARRLSCGGRVSVLMKAGHLCGSDVTDIFYNAETDSINRFTHPRIDTPNTHGTGCTLSSALASYLAQGLDPDAAVGAAIDYVSKAIASGSAYTTGHGHGPVDHFFKLRQI